MTQMSFSMDELASKMMGMMVSLGAFGVIYELIMYCYSEKIKKISVKEIMLE